jgi:membrane-bound ClpP family serine protease
MRSWLQKKGRSDLMTHITPSEVLLLVVAVVLMLGGAALMLADLVSPGIAIPLIAVGIALSVVAQTRRRRQDIPSH